MNVKTDTKEKFTVITPKESAISANMTDTLKKLLIAYSEKDIPHIILNMGEVTLLCDEAAEMIAGVQQQFYEKNASFIVCGLQKEVENRFIFNNLMDTMNITPTESEAWDILQMEEIERELMSGFDDNIDEQDPNN